MKPFTLLELLIVIAVIAILAGMLLPAFGSARESGLAAECGNNLRQVGLMHIQYTGSFNGFFCPACNVECDQWDSSADHRKPGFLAAAMTEADASGQKVFECPSARRSGLVFQRGWTAAFAGFGYNYLLSFNTVDSPRDQYRGLRLEDVRRPGSCLMLGDAAYFSGPGKLAPTAFLYPPSSGQGGYADFRHAGKASAVFADGHAEGSLPFCPRPPDSSGYAERIGYFSADDSVYDPFFR